MPGKLLLVDDEPHNLRILEELLEDYEVASVSSGPEALEELDVFRPDLILLDVMMPHMDGYEVCRRVRESPDHDFMKILFVSGRALAEDRLMGYQVGGDDYVTKPLDHEELLAKVRVFLRLKRSEQINRMKGDFLALISHETRTPLTGIIGNAELMLTHTECAPELLELARTIRSCGWDLLGFIEKATLLSELKAQSGVASKLFCVRDLVAPLESRLAEAVAESGASLKWSLSDSTLRGDTSLLLKALTLVIENALRFTPPDGRVSIDGQPGTGSYVIGVTDPGPGLSPDRYEGIFEEFSVGDVEHHTSGQGISLALARRIALLHGGHLYAASEPGAGATFTFELPLAPLQDVGLPSAVESI